MIRDILAPNPGPFTLYGTRTWLIGSRVMIDPGPLIESHVEALLVAQPDVTDILITHRHADHAPAARPIAQHVDNSAAVGAESQGLCDGGVAVDR